MSNDDPKKDALGWAKTATYAQAAQAPVPWNGPPIYPHQHTQPHPQQPHPPHPQPRYAQGYPQQAEYPQPQYPQPQPYAHVHGYQGYPQHTPQPYQLPEYLQTHQPYPPAPVAPPARMPRGSKPPRSIASADATHGASPRLRFIRLTYLHLFAAMLAFGGLLHELATNPLLAEKVSAPLVRFALGGRWNWGVILLAFMAVSWLADYWARHTTSRGVQYLGLGLYIIAEALIFVPLLAIVEWKTQAILSRGGAEPHIIRDAAYITLGIFTALTLSVFLTRKDFSFLRSGLYMASGGAVTFVFLALGFGFNLGLMFSVAMVVLAAAYILYQTSQVLAHYHPGQHVGASLALFSSVALMFWYVIRIVLRARE